MIKKILKKIITKRMIREYFIWKNSIDWVLLNNIFSIFPSQTIRKAFLRIKGATIHNDVRIFGGCEFRSPKGLIIEKGSTIGHRTILDSREGLKIGSNVVISTEVMIWTLHHDYNDVNFKTIGGKVSINDYAWLCSRCIILPGVNIGEGAVIATGAVVTKDVDAYTIVGGIPAKKIGIRNSNLKYVPSNYKLHFA
jgi:acetyltransferase-like isoleucine patch superfamily enzyme